MSAPVIIRRRRLRGGAVAFSPASLFASGAYGALLDYTQTALGSTVTMFSDSGVTQAVAGATAQLVLDTKSGAPVLGPELVTNGGFDVNISGWTAGAAATILRSTDHFPSGNLRVTATGGTFSYAVATVTGLVAGRWYVISSDTYSPSSNSSGDKATIGVQGSSFTSAGSIQSTDFDDISRLEISFVATGTSQNIYASVVSPSFSNWGTSGSVAHFDNISVRELPGVHASQINSALRPAVIDQGNGFFALRHDGSDDRLVQTFPDAFSGDVFVAGRAGCWVEEGVSVAAGGTLQIGPTDGPITAGLVSTVGGVDRDLLAVISIARTLTQSEREKLTAFYQARGAGPLLN